MRQTDSAATAAEIPGLVIRAYGGEADLPDVARVQSAEWAADGVSERASIVRSLYLLRERGLTTAALGVDADNPSGAFGLYESAGFHPTERFVSWRKPMELDR